MRDDEDIRTQIVLRATFGDLVIIRLRAALRGMGLSTADIARIVTDGDPAIEALLPPETA